MIIFARHAQTEAGEEGRYEGLADSPLTDLGKRQAKELGQYLQDTEIDQVIVSPRNRAIETATIATSKLNVALQVDKNLAEVCYGAWEHEKKEKVKKTEVWLVRKNDPFHFVHPGFYINHPGESYAMLFERVKESLQLFNRSKDNILVISHLGILRCVQMFFSGIDEKEFMSLQYSNTILSIVSKEHKINHFDYFFQKSAIL